MNNITDKAKAACKASITCFFNDYVQIALMGFIFIASVFSREWIVGLLSFFVIAQFADMSEKKDLMKRIKRLETSDSKRWEVVHRFNKAGVTGVRIVGQGERGK